MSAELARALQSAPSLPWRAAESTAHILTRQGHELARFADRQARDLAVAAVNGSADLIARVAGMELDLEAARKQRDAVGEAHVRLGGEARELLDAVERVVADAGSERWPELTALMVKHGRLKP